MSLKKFEFGFGNTTQSVELPEEHIQEVLHGRNVPAVDVKEATLRCLRQPIASKPLQELVSAGDKVCLVVADATRIWNRSHEFLIHVVNELNLAGIPDEDMYIVFAQGTHRAHTPEENVRVVGEEVARRIRMYQHDCLNNEELTLVGTTKLGTPVVLNKRVVEADKIIVAGGITPHLFAGYGASIPSRRTTATPWPTVSATASTLKPGTVSSTIIL